MKHKDYLDSLQIGAALWWFIENVAENDIERTDYFFYLRERVRNEFVADTPPGGIYTVILLRPDYIADSSLHPDTFTSYEQAANPTDAVVQARKTAYLADNADNPDDYALIAVYEGCLENLAND